jgi:hypothetical protein
MKRQAIAQIPLSVQSAVNQLLDQLNTISDNFGGGS